MSLFTAFWNKGLADGEYGVPSPPVPREDSEKGLDLPVLELRGVDEGVYFGGVM